MSPYRSVEHALRCAYDHRPVIETPSCFLIGGGAAVSEFWSGLSRWDRVAQGAMTRSLVMETLSGIHIAVVDLYYTAPGPEKARLCEAVGKAVWDEMSRRPNREYLVDCCRHWSGLPWLKAEKDWEADCRVSARTLRRWRNGERHRPGAMKILDRWLWQARNMLAPVFRESGLIP